MGTSCRHRAVLVTVLVCAGAAPAAADDPWANSWIGREPGEVAGVDVDLDLVDELRSLRRGTAMFRDLAAAMSNPDALREISAAMYGTLLSDPVVGPLLSDVVNQYRGGFVTIDADALVVADTGTPGSVMASASASWEIPLCRILGGQASAQGGLEDGDPLLAYTASAGGCIPLPGNTADFTYTRRGNVRPSLLSGPIVLRERRTSDLYDFGVRFWRYRGTTNQVDVGVFRATVDAEHEGATIGRVLATIELTPARWVRRGRGLVGRDQTWAFMHTHGSNHGDDGQRSASVVVLAPVTFDSVPLGPGLALGAELGWAMGAYGADSRVTDPVVDARGPYAELWLDGVAGPAQGQLRLGHTISPTFDAQLVGDDRLSARAELVRHQLVAGADGFVARQRLHRQGADATRVAGGAAVDAALALTRHLRLQARIEAARTLDVVLTTDAVGLRTDLRASAGVAGHFDHRW
ncbi:MAG: hypothetical protein KBG28_22165 [Kofleriaceae bacterium]|nr:hypothetical protein [Kofleriaceae bacterium]MBP6838990.1 hypothetical protein [Kofleriaceae bacterium]MBP9206694.1 hypothetical protein [Kofleriaceae bacterium]